LKLHPQSSPHGGFVVGYEEADAIGYH
jgi:hypothetical protein